MSLFQGKCAICGKVTKEPVQYLCVASIKTGKFNRNDENCWEHLHITCVTTLIQRQMNEMSLLSKINGRQRS